MPQKRFTRSNPAWLTRLRRISLTSAAVLSGTVTALLVAAPFASAAPTAPPPLTFLTSSGPVGHGDIFITPTGDTSTYANGPEILSPNGNVVWFHPIPQGDAAGDFRTQRYEGKPVLTFWVGTGFGGLSSGTDYIYNDHYQQIAAVNAGNGLSADGHEFLITPWNTALILSYQESTANLTSIGGPADQTVINGVVQEIDIRTGRVLFQWNSADHVPYSESEQALPTSASTPWDWFHINAVKLDTDGNLLIDSRATWTLFKVNRHTGNTIWQLGGKASSFRIDAAPGQTLNKDGDIFAWQHDPESLGHGYYSVFDNESAGEFNLGVDVSSEFPISRVVKFKLDLRDRTATLVQSDNQPEGLEASSQGDGQPLPGGGVFAGWGNLNYISEFDGAGNVVFDAEFPTGVNSYRAYLLPWGPEQRGPRGRYYR
jgi:hypothetical protein